MIAAVIALALLLALVLILFQGERASWAKERQLLLERIQKPERVLAVGETKAQAPLESDREQFAKIGVIFGDEDNQ